MDNQVELNTITDLDELRKMYVTFNENLNVSQEQVRIAEHNLNNVRGRMLELQNEQAASAQAAAEKAEKAAASNANRAERRRASRKTVSSKSVSKK